MQTTQSWHSYLLGSAIIFAAFVFAVAIIAFMKLIGLVDYDHLWPAYIIGFLILALTVGTFKKYNLALKHISPVAVLFFAGCALIFLEIRYPWLF